MTVPRPYSFARELTKLIEHLTGLTAKTGLYTKKARFIKPRELIDISKQYRRNELITMSDQVLYMHEELLISAAPLLMDQLKLVSEEARDRRAKSKLVTR